MESQQVCQIVPITRTLDILPGRRLTFRQPRFFQRQSAFQRTCSTESTWCSVSSMEQVKTLRKTLFVFVWGVLMWGGSTALAITLFDWYTTHRIETPYNIVGRFVIFMALGILQGLFMWNRLETLGHTKPTRTGSIVRGVLFIGLMLGLSYALWTMSRH